MAPPRPRIAHSAALLAAAIAGLLPGASRSEPAAWFPDPPASRAYFWEPAPFPGCSPLRARPEWLRMAALAGIPAPRFLRAPDELSGQAFASPPGAVALSPSALALDGCQLAFVVGHEIAHLALRHFDEDAATLFALSGSAPSASARGEDALALLDFDFGLALRVAHLWQAQEAEADWIGSLLAAQAAACRIEEGALPYLRASESGGGLGAAHAPSPARAQALLPFSESARRLASSSLEASP